MPSAATAGFQDHGRGSARLGRRNARQDSQARSANSNMCAALRTSHRTVSTASAEMSALSQRSNGSSKDEVCCVDWGSADALKIAIIQISKGNQ